MAVCDQNNLFAMVKFYKEALKSGVKPLVGVDLLVREEGERAALHRQHRERNHRQQQADAAEHAGQIDARIPELEQYPIDADQQQE